MAISRLLSCIKPGVTTHNLASVNSIWVLFRLYLDPFGIVWFSFWHHGGQFRFMLVQIGLMLDSKQNVGPPGLAPIICFGRLWIHVGWTWISIGPVWIYMGRIWIYNWRIWFYIGRIWFYIGRIWGLAYQIYRCFFIHWLTWRIQARLEGRGLKKKRQKTQGF